MEERWVKEEAMGEEEERWVEEDSRAGLGSRGRCEGDESRV